CHCFLSSSAATTDIYALSLHDALPISTVRAARGDDAAAHRGVPGGEGGPRRARGGDDCRAQTLSTPAPLPWARLGRTRRTPETRSEEHTSELQSRSDLVCRLLLEKKKK